MEQNCKGCDVFYNSEGHENGEWLTFCHECNKKYSPKELDTITEAKE